jgi:hypothetical protein
MVRHLGLKWHALLGGLFASVLIGLCAVPAAATMVCIPGHQGDPNYCTNFKPTATTTPASNVEGTSARLNGVAGATVPGGDPTQFFFEYGTTTAYGTTTPTGTLGACQPGHSPPSPYCTTPNHTNVSAKISSLTPCTTYHYRLVATNPDGTTQGLDSSFRTRFAKPIAKVKFNRRVRPHHRFTVTITLRHRALVKLFLKKSNGHILKVYKLGTRNPGTIRKKIRAPRREGHYRLNTFARLSCGTQSVRKRFRVI